MKILGIETSCDDTAVAVVEDAKRVLAHRVSSQLGAHIEFGGVVPEIAARQHLQALAVLVQNTLQSASLSMDDIDAIAVTQGPGLIGSLLIGVSYAKGLALSSGKPLVPLDHVHAHIHGALLSLAEKDEPIQFPLIALVASGGHCNLYVLRSHTQFELIGYSIDDACGECFDKVAKKLGHDYPGGPIIEQLAATGDANKYPMPRMMEQKDRFEFSYSGLKTHMVNLITKHQKDLTPQMKSDFCAAFQKEALGQLIRKLKNSYAAYPEAKGILVAGGVAANKYFATELTRTVKCPIVFPELRYCSDNASMVAAYGFHLINQGQTISLLDEWDAYSRYNFSGHLRHTVGKL